MITYLIDHNIEGYAVLLWGTLVAEGWLDLVSLRLVTFAEVGLAADSSDRDIWLFAQQTPPESSSPRRKPGSSDFNHRWKRLYGTGSNRLQPYRTA